MANLSSRCYTCYDFVLNCFGGRRCSSGNPQVRDPICDKIREVALGQVSSDMTAADVGSWRLMSIQTEFDTRHPFKFTAADILGPKKSEVPVRTRRNDRP